MSGYLSSYLAHNVACSRFQVQWHLLPGCMLLSALCTLKSSHHLSWHSSFTTATIHLCHLYNSNQTVFSCKVVRQSLKSRYVQFNSSIPDTLVFFHFFEQTLEQFPLNQDYQSFDIV